MASTYDLRGKIDAKSKVNMKSYMHAQEKQKKFMTPSRLITSQNPEFDRAS